MKVDIISIPNFKLRRVYGMFRSQNFIGTVYEGRFIPEKLIVLRGIVTGADRETAFNNIQTLYNTYASDTQILVYAGVQKNATLGGINIISEKDLVANGYEIEIEMVWQEE